MDAAYEYGYEVVETTQGMNGYPQGLGKAVIGFETFEDAKDFAREIGGQVVDLCKRDGWQFWKSNGRVWEEWKMNAEDYGDDYECVTDAQEWWQGEREIMSEVEYDTPEDMYEHLEMIKDIYEEIEGLCENEQLLICRGRRYDTEVIPIKTMRYHIDVWRHEIGVV